MWQAKAAAEVDEKQEGSVHECDVGSSMADLVWISLLSFSQ